MTIAARFRISPPAPPKEAVPVEAASSANVFQLFPQVKIKCLRAALQVARANTEETVENDKKSVPCYNIKMKEHLINYLMTEADLDEKHKDRFRLKLAELILDLKTEDRRAALAGRKLRDYRPREGIVEYLTSPEGAGPWLEAGVLTRPFLFQHAPKAYRALRNYEARGLRLPADLRLPSRSEVVDRELSHLGEEGLRTAGRLDAIARWRSKNRLLSES